MTIWSSIWLILIASLLICHYTLIISYSFLCVYTCSFSVSFLCLCSRICVNWRLRDTNKNITWICSIIFSLSHTTVCQLLYLLPSCHIWFVFTHFFLFLLHLFEDALSPAKTSLSSVTFHAQMPGTCRDKLKLYHLPVVICVKTSSMQTNFLEVF